jgi:hypothetical protein
MSNDRLIAWIAGRGRQVTILASVCTGALLLGRAGLLDGRRATTHWKALRLMRERFPAVSVRDDLHVVEDGEVITSAGISAGIDLALRVVARHHGESVARATARHMEYPFPDDNRRRVGEGPGRTNMARKKQHATGEPPIPEAARPAYEAVVGLIDAFCREHLDEEYRVLSRKLAGILARKRPSPLTRGKPESWASGIVRVVGWANFLGDPSQPHHMKMTDIDKGFGVSEATGSAKSMAIRDLLRIDRLSPEWTLPSRMEANPLVWMLKVNGLITDIRLCPREAQVVAFEKGLIPYIPADRPAGVKDDKQ